MQLPVSITLQPSRWLGGLLWLAHAVALALVFLLPFMFWLKAALGLALPLSLLMTLQHLQRDARYRLMLRRDGQLEFFPKVDAGGTLCTLSAVRRLGGLIVLGVQAGEWRRYLVLLPDTANAADMRRLRVWLDWRKPS